MWMDGAGRREEKGKAESPDPGSPVRVLWRETKWMGGWVEPGTRKHPSTQARSTQQLWQQQAMETSEGAAR